MITGYIVSWFADFVAFAGSLLTLPAPPPFLATIGGFISQAAGYVASTEVWMPWTLLATVIGVWVAFLVAGIAIKLTRIVLSFLTLGGGSAA